MKIVYNPKLEYLICKWLCQPKKNHDEIKLRLVYEGKTVPKTIDQHTIYNLKKVWIEIKKQNYSCAYWILTNKRIDVELAALLLSIQHERFNELEILVKLFSHQSYSGNALMFMILFYNYMRINSGLTPIFCQMKYLKDIYKFSQSKDIETVEQILQILNVTAQRINRVSKYITLEKISYLLYEKKDELANDLKIKAVYVYGSFARNSMNKYSDIDLIVVTKKSNYDQADIFKIQAFIEHIIGIKTDIYMCLKKLDLTMFDKYIKKDLKKII